MANWYAVAMSMTAAMTSFLFGVVSIKHHDLFFAAVDFIFCGANLAMLPELSDYIKMLIADVKRLEALVEKYEIALKKER